MSTTTTKQYSTLYKLAEYNKPFQTPALIRPT